MGIGDQQTQQKFPFSYNEVFDGLMKLLPELGFEVKSHDKVIGRINTSAGMSMFSWGENIDLSVEKIDDTNTLVAIGSALKLGVNLAGSHRHQKNFEKIIMGLSRELQARAAAGG